MTAGTGPSIRVALAAGLCLFAAFSSSGRVHADRDAAATTGTVTISPHDTYLNLDGTNYSAQPLLRTYTWPDYKPANVIAMTFDLSAIPAGAVVEQATLQLVLVESDQTADTTYTVTAHKVIGKNPSIGKATGYTADGVAGWRANTCCYNSVPLAQADLSTAYDTPAIDKTPGVKTWNVTAMVQEWLQDPATNFGLLLNSDASTLRDRYRYFASMEHADPSLRPSLRVTFVAPDATPPTVAITAPADGASLAGTVAPAASATDDSGVASVQFLLNGTRLGAEITAAPYSFNWDTTAVSDGAYTFAAVAKDWSGNASTSAGVGVIVKNGLLRLSPVDTFLNLDAVNYSTHARLLTYTWPDYKVANAIVMKFDLSRVPSGASVDEAKLHLALVESDPTMDTTYAIGAHKILGRNPDIAKATGYTADGATSWTATACCYNGVPLAQADIAPALDTRAVDKNSVFKTWTITTMVQDWLANPAANFGVLLNSDASRPRDRYRAFASVDHPDTTRRPFLVLRYSNADATTPVVTVTAPAAGATVTGIVTVAADANDNIGVAGVQFQIDGLNVGPEVTAAPYSLTWDTTTTSDGSHTLTAVARDAAGNTAASAALSVTVSNVDTMAPTVAISAPLGGATVSGTVAVAASATDDVGVVGVQFTLDGVNLGAEDTTAPYTGAWDTTRTSDGSHTLTAVARDAAGSRTTSSAVTVSVANSIQVSLVPQDTFIGLDGTNNSIETQLMTYTWPDNRVANAILMKFDLSGIPAGVVVQDATLQLALVASDASADSIYTVSAHKIVGKDPLITAATGYTTDGVTDWTANTCCYNSVPLAQGDISAAYDTRAVDKTLGYKTWAITSMVQEWLATPTTNFGLLLNSDASKLRDRFRAFASMEHPDVTLRPVLRITYAATSDATRPSVSITAPAAGATVSGTVAVAASASDNVGVVGVQFKLDGVNLGPEDTSSPYSLSWNTTTVADGSHTLTVVARDAAGNQSTSAAVTLTVSNSVAPGTGIAALYPGDVGIEGHADVVFVERFEDSLSDVFARWTQIHNGPKMSLTSDVPAGSTGSRSLDIPWEGGGVSNGGHLYKQLNPVDDVLYVRYYIKYPTTGNYQHEGIWVGGYNPSLTYPNPQAGTKPAGNDRFSAAAEQSDDATRFDHYNYWMNMRMGGDGKYWGNTLLNNPNVKATAGQWVCVEQMVKLNNPVTAFNGEHAIWLDGVKVSHVGEGFPNGFWSGGSFTQDPNGSPFEGMRWRSDANLRLNWIWLQNYSPKDPAGFVGHMSFDHVVVAKSYIGCLAPSGAADTTPPVVTVTAPAAGSTVAGAAVTVAGAASDDGGIAGVQFQLDGVNLGAEDTTAPYSVSWDTTAAVNGSHLVTAVARDTAGNTGTSAGVTVTVANDTIAPTISAVGATGITASAATITWTTDETSDSQVEYGATTAYGSMTAVNGSLVTAHVVPLSGLSTNTVYHFRVRSRDAAGNVAVSGDLTFTTLADLTPPSVSISAPAPGATISGTVTVAAAAADDVGVVGVQFQLNGANLGAEDTNSPYSVGWSTSAAADGTYVLTAVARDAAGNTTTSATVGVTVANALVEVALAPLDTFINLDSTNYSASAQLATYTWPDNQAANAILMKFDMGSIPAGAVLQEATLHLALVGSDLTADNTYTVAAHKVVGKNVVIAGASGYTADGVTGWTANTCCYNSVPLAQGDISAAYDTQAVDKTLGYKTWTITTMVQEWLANPATNFGLLLNSDNAKLRDRYRYFASMEHADAGLRPFLRVRYSLTPDTMPPAVSITSPATGATLFGTVPVEAAATDDVAVASVQFTIDGAALGTQDTTAPYAVSWDTSSMLNGSHTLTAVAKDGAGNVSSSTAITVTISNGEVMLAWDPNTEADLAGYRVYIGESSRVYPTKVTVGTTTSYTVTGLQPGRVYYFAVTAYDALGNESGFSTEVSFLVPDSTAMTFNSTGAPVLAEALGRFGTALDRQTTVTPRAGREDAVVHAYTGE